MENQTHQLTNSNLEATSLQNHAFHLLNLMDRTDESRMALDRFKTEKEGLFKRLEEASGRKRIVSPRFSFLSEYYVSGRNNLRRPNCLWHKTRDQSSEGNLSAYEHTSTPEVHHPRIGLKTFKPNPHNKLSPYHPSSSNKSIDNRSSRWSSSSSGGGGGGKNKRKATPLVPPEVSPSPPSKRINRLMRDGYKGYHTSTVQEKSSETNRSRNHAMKIKSPVSTCCRCNCGNKPEREKKKVEDSCPTSIPKLDSFDLCYEDDDISVWSFDETHSPGYARNSQSFYVED